MGFGEKKVKPTQEKCKQRFGGTVNLDTEKFFRTGILPFDLLTEGRGWPCGNFVNIFSQSKFGKSTALLDAIRNMIAREPVFNATEYLDVEGTSDVIATSMGLMNDESKFLYLRPSFYDELQDATDAWFTDPTANYRMLCIDTISAVSPDLEAIREMGITKATVGLDARIRTSYLKLWHNMIKRTNKTIVYITQVRAQIEMGRKGGSFNKSPDDMYKAEGGFATEFFADLQIKFVGNSRLQSDTLNQDGSKGGVGKTGYMLAEKNKYSTPMVKIPFALLYGEGISNVLFLKDYCMWRGLAEARGSTYSCRHPATGEECSVKGRAGYLEWIRNFYGALVEDFYTNAPEYFRYFHLQTGKAVDSDED
jgi:RecA/RadA recombinase